MDDLLTTTIADRRFNMLLLGTCAAVALTLAGIGIYGLIAYSAAWMRSMLFQVDPLDAVTFAVVGWGWRPSRSGEICPARPRG